MSKLVKNLMCKDVQCTGECGVLEQWWRRKIVPGGTKSIPPIENFLKFWLQRCFSSKFWYNYNCNARIRYHYENKERKRRIVTMKTKILVIVIGLYLQAEYYTDKIWTMWQTRPKSWLILIKSSKASIVPPYRVPTMLMSLSWTIKTPKSWWRTPTSLIVIKFPGDNLDLPWNWYRAPL